MYIVVFVTVITCVYALRWSWWHFRV